MIKNAVNSALQNKNDVMFITALVFMGGILSYFNDNAILCAGILTVIAILAILKNFLPLKYILFWICIFYLGFFNSYFRIHTTDGLVPEANQKAVLKGQAVSIPNSNDKLKTKFFFKVYEINNKKTSGKTLVTVTADDGDFSEFQIGDFYEMKGNLRNPFKAGNPSQFDYGKYLRNFDTSKVKTMQNMFYGCRGMQELNVSSFNTQNVTNMSGMFGENINLNSLDVRNFNTSKVQNMSSMFVALYKVPELDLSNFDTSNVTNMQRMFYDNNTFTSLDISSFDTSNVTNMEEMFANMRKLNTLNMQNMVFDAVTSFDSMLDNVLVLNKIIVKDAAAKEFVEARMTDAGKSADITIYE